MPDTRNPPRAMRWAAWLPLAAHVLPTLFIGFGIVIPGSCIEGLNQYTIGFLLAVAGFVPAYAAGLALGRREAVRA